MFLCNQANTLHQAYLGAQPRPRPRLYLYLSLRMVCVAMKLDQYVSRR